MQAGDKITRNCKIYEAVCYNNGINGEKKSERVDPCTLCVFNPETNDFCKDIDCINENEFLYIKEVK
jgi:hypothetical protein